jgi:hypothetical protein
VSASAIDVTLSPRKSSVTISPAVWMTRAASIASSTVSPAMNRRANPPPRRMP